MHSIINLPRYKITSTQQYKHSLVWSDKMAEKNYKQKNMAAPIEKHNTAAWANIEKKKPESGVTIPSELQVENAKEYADSNQK